MKERQVIYYLDIDNQDLYLFKHIIEGLGHKIFIYKDGFKMMQDLSKLETNPDILFLGNNMPILNGKELLVVLKNSKKLNDIPVVVISSALPKKLILHYMNTGVKHIMKKTHASDYRNTFNKVLKMDFTLAS